MRTISIDDRKVIARNARFIGNADTNVVKRGRLFVWNDAGQLRLCRSLGRIAKCDSDGDDCTGFVVAMVLHVTASFAFERWINPDDIQEVYKTVPGDMAAFFFAPELPFGSHTMRRLMEYGTVAQHHVAGAAARVAQWAAQANAA